MNRTPTMNVATVLESIGMTPVVRLDRVVPEGYADVYVKLEYLNPTGSYKDRMALAMIEEAEARGDPRPGMTVVEYTGGSTGSSLAFVCAVKGYRFRAVSSDAFADEKLKTMKLFGADLHIIPSVGGKAEQSRLDYRLSEDRERAAPAIRSADRPVLRRGWNGRDADGSLAGVEECQHADPRRRA